MTKDNMKKLKKGEKNSKNYKISKRKLVWIICIAILITIILTLFGTKIYLWFKFIIGNDIIINVEATPKDIFSSNGESKIITLKTSIIANPFCGTDCSYEFRDISDNISIDQQNANIKTLNSLNKEYTLIAPEKSTGQVLYRFDVQCKSLKSFLCQTSGDLNKRSVLITLDYNLSQEQQLEKDNFKKVYLNLTKKVNENILFLEQIKINLNNSLLNLNGTNNLIYSLNNFSDSINKTIVFWDSQEYSSANILLNGLQKDYELIESDFDIFNQILYDNLNKNNQLSLLLDNLVKNVSHITTLSLNATDILIGEEIVKSTNQIIDNLKNNSIALSESKITEVQNKTSIFLSSDKNNVLGSKINITLKNYVPFLINLNISIIEQNYSIKEPSSKCCLFNKCDSCCDSSCYDNPEKYPVVFIHGHDFSSSISPDYNLNIFEGLQRSIEEDGYLNAGSLILGTSETKGLLGETNNPVSLKASYYFDSIPGADNKINILYTKQDSIDTYAVRLKEIIEEIKVSTNKEKVVLVTHSMGGLVARRYIQVFGDGSIDKIIMIAAPNHGINKELYNSCKLFGATAECNDMYETSLLISKLNTQKDLGKTKVYNIVGIGCDTYGQDGDGVVMNSSAYLSFAKNYYVNGTCSGFDYFHNRIINPLKTPEIKDVVLKAMKEE